MRPELRIRGEAATYDGGGILTDPKYGGARVQFRTGTRDQLPFDQSIGREGANAIAYRQGILISIENMPLRPFNGIIPFLGCEISGDRQPAIPAIRNRSWTLVPNGMARPAMQKGLFSYVRNPTYAGPSKGRTIDAHKNQAKEEF